MSKTAKSVKAICRKYDKFLCVESPDSNALLFPSIAVSSFRKPDIEQALEKLLEITNNDELAISRHSPRDKARIHVIIFAIAITKSTSLPTDSVPSGSLSKRWHTTSGFRKTRRWQTLSCLRFRKVPIQRRQQSNYGPTMRLAEHWKKSISTTPKNKGIKVIQAM